MPIFTFEGNEGARPFCTRRHPRPDQRL